MSLALRLVTFAVLTAVVLPAVSARGEEVGTTLAPAMRDPDEQGAVEVPGPEPLAVRFHQTGHYVWAFGRFWTLAVPLVLLVTGASARFRDLAGKASRGWFVPTVAIYSALFLTTVYLVGLPWSYFAGFVRPHAYGLSNQTFGKWFVDGLLALGVDVAGAAAFAWVPFWLIGRFPKTWWLILSALSVPFLAFVMLITPVFIDPLFNDFGPMKDQALEGKIIDLAGRAGIEGGRVFEVDKSVDTKAANAYVTGFWGTKRIVLWDTLLGKFDDKEVLAVMGHEMGHYVLNHVAWSITLASLVTLAGLFWTDRAGRWLLARFGARWGIASLSDAAAAPLLLLLLGVSSVALAPVALAYSRYQEHEADRFALELTGLNRSAARAFVGFQRENLGVPQPDLFCRVFRSTHPSIAERVAFCNEYRPWLDGRPSRYADRFRP